MTTAPDTALNAVANDAPTAASPTDDGGEERQRPFVRIADRVSDAMGMCQNIAAGGAQAATPAAARIETSRARSTRELISSLRKM